MRSPLHPVLPGFAKHLSVFGIFAVAAVALAALLSGCVIDSASDGIARADAPRSQPALFAQAAVQQAIDRYDADGLDETLDHYNSPESMDGQWYVFIFDEEGDMIAHAANQDLVGVNFAGVLGPNNYPVGQLLVDSATEDGAFVDYIFPDAAGRIGQKHSWVIEHDGLVFGAGWYENAPRKSDQPGYTQAYVEQALNLYDASGRDAATAYYNKPASVDGQWYVFIIDENGTMLAHTDQSLVGIHTSEIVGANEYPSGKIVLADADEDGAWSQYSFFNPETGGAQIKHSWLVKHDGLIFGSGWYEDGPRKSDQPAYTQAVVDSAVNLYQSLGIEQTLAYYNTDANIDDQWYTFVISLESGKSIGHYRPEIRERDPSERVDIRGNFYGDDLLAATEEGRWVSYWFRNPNTGEERSKHTWIVRQGDYLFGSGWYE